MARLAFFDSVRQAVVVFNFAKDLVVIPAQTTLTFDWSPMAGLSLSPAAPPLARCTTRNPG